MANGVAVGTKERPSIEQRNDHKAMGTFSMRQRRLPLGALLGEATRVLTLIAARQPRPTGNTRGRFRCRKVMDAIRQSGLLRPDAGRPNDLAPFFRFGDHEAGEFRGRGREWLIPCARNLCSPFWGRPVER